MLMALAVRKKLLARQIQLAVLLQFSFFFYRLLKFIV
jgi:hypothetical protein